MTSQHSTLQKIDPGSCTLIACVGISAQIMLCLLLVYLYFWVPRDDTLVTHRVKSLSYAIILCVLIVGILALQLGQVSSGNCCDHNHHEGL